MRCLIYDKGVMNFPREALCFSGDGDAAGEAVR